MNFKLYIIIGITTLLFLLICNLEPSDTESGMSLRFLGHVNAQTDPEEDPPVGIYGRTFNTCSMQCTNEDGEEITVTCSNCSYECNSQGTFQACESVYCDHGFCDDYL